MLERGQVWLFLGVRLVSGRTFPYATLPRPHHLCAYDPRRISQVAEQRSVRKIIHCDMDGAP